VRFARVLADLLGLAIFANVFVIYFVTQEHYIYYWDLSGYWSIYLDKSASFLQNPIIAIRSVISSIQHDDYNPLPVLPLIPFEWLFGPSRLTYILAITNVFLLPGVLLMGLLVQRILQSPPHKRPLASLVLATASILAFFPLWVAVLEGLPDVVGIVVIGAIFLLHFAKPISEHRLGNLLTTGILLALLVLLRRYYAIWVVAFFPALAVSHGLDIYQRHGVAWRLYVTAIRNAFLIGLTFVLVLLVVATPLVLRVIHTDYSDIYSAYRKSSSVVEAAMQLPFMFGWFVIVCSLIGLMWLSARKETRVVGSFLITHSFIVFVLFAQTQDLDLEHSYVLIPGIVIGIAVVVVDLWAMITYRVCRVAAICLLATLVTTSAITFFPSAASLSDVLGKFGPQVYNYPNVRNDIEAFERLVDRLDELELNQSGDIYVLASSEILNSSIMRNYCVFGVRRRFSCDRILDANDVDKRDGFPRQFLHAHYLLVAVPTQYHLRAEDQRVIGVLARKVTEGDGVGASFERLPGEFKLDNGVSASLFAKVRPLERMALDALEDEFAGYYPDKRELFKVAVKVEIKSAKRHSEVAQPERPASIPAEPALSTSCALDVVDNAVTSAAVTTIADTEAAMLVGWAVDEKAGTTPQSVFVRLSGGSDAYIKAVRTTRPDVADYFHNPNLINSGWALSADLSSLPKGAYVVNLIQVEGSMATICHTGKSISLN
jgi:hypothetical protein